MLYATEAIRQIYTPQAKIDHWAQVERAVLKAQARRGLIPDEWRVVAENTPPPTVERVEQATAETGHEIVGFLKAWGLDHVHIGLTSSDITDTTMALQLKTTNQVLVWEALRTRDAILDFSIKHLHTYRAGRTHGQYATIDSLGRTFAGFAFMFTRGYQRLQATRAHVEVAKISGPTGAYLEIEFDTAEHAAVNLGLRLEPMTTQILARDSLADWAACCIGLINTCEAVNLEIRLGTHSSIDEMRLTQHEREGSSAMPHKNNPTDSERITGIARLARSTYEPISAGISQWHERDMAHSSVERVLIPQLAGWTDFALTETRKILGQVDVQTDQLNKALDRPELGSHQFMTELQLRGLPYFDARDQTKKAQNLLGIRPSLSKFEQLIRTHGSRPTQ